MDEHSTKVKQVSTITFYSYTGYTQAQAPVPDVCEGEKFSENPHIPHVPT